MTHLSDSTYARYPVRYDAAVQQVAPGDTLLALTPPTPQAVLSAPGL
jgi:hypothetical protein